MGIPGRVLIPLRCSRSYANLGFSEVSATMTIGGVGWNYFDGKFLSTLLSAVYQERPVSLGPCSLYHEAIEQNDRKEAHIHHLSEGRITE